MLEVKIVNKKRISTGIILKELINDGRKEGKYKNNADFVDKFSRWVDERLSKDKTASSKQEFSELTEQQLSAWIRGKNQPKKSLKLSLLAEFLDVSEEYLLCETTNRTRMKKNVSWNDFIKRHQNNQAANELSEEVKRVSQIDHFKDYCSHIGINFDYDPTSAKNTVYTESYIEAGVRYTVEITDYEGDDPIIRAIFPDGQTMQITDDQLYVLAKECNNYINFKFSELRKEVKENDK